ncbi:MAG: hypothetical protein ACR2MP_21515, partial [Streptosporangiaceae bacterium]
PGAAAAAAGRPAGALPASTASTSTGTGAAASGRIIKTNRGRGLPGITAVTATSPDHAWAFASTLARPVAWRLTCRRWAAVPSPGQAGDLVTAAASSARDNVWAFTARPAGAGQALRWDGRRWVTVRRFAQAIGDAVVLGPADVWVFGQPLSLGRLGAWHYTGRTWRRYPAAGALTGGSALGPDSIWAVGGKTAAHWNGHTWSRTSLARVLPRNTQFCRPSADKVLARSATDVWAVGAGHCQDERGPFYLLHFNGSRWRLVSQSARYGEPLQVVPDGSGGLWIPAVAGFPGTFAMLHYTGGHLQRAMLPLPGTRLTVDAVAHVPGSAVTFGGGGSHPAGQAGTKQSAVILRYGG